MSRNHFFRRKNTSEFEVSDHCQASCPKEPRLKEVSPSGSGMNLKIWEDFRLTQHALSRKLGISRIMWLHWPFTSFHPFFPGKIPWITQSWHGKVLKIQAPSMYLVKEAVKDGRQWSAKATSNYPKSPNILKRKAGVPQKSRLHDLHLCRTSHQRPYEFFIPPSAGWALKEVLRSARWRCGGMADASQATNSKNLPSHGDVWAYYKLTIQTLEHMDLIWFDIVIL